MASPLLLVKNLIKYFRNPNSNFSIKDKWIKAVDGVTFEIYPGETVGIVGESGCGKSTLGRTIVGLNKPNSGEIYFLGEDLLKMSEYSRKKLSKKMQIIFQDPAGSLNPRRTIEETLMDPFSIHGLYEKSERKEIIKELIVDVGLDLYHLDRYPHELSGGQKQRVGIARALAMKPEFIICDEPVSALDVSVQAQIINLFQDMKKKFSFSSLFISHDLSVIYHISDRIMVMYLGSIVEIASYKEIYKDPLHPYTQLLIKSNPILDLEGKKNNHLINSEISPNSKKLNGCSFSDRCPMVFEICKQKRPLLKGKNTKHFVACHLY